ncbi:hypothetical protein F4859DRAFT_518613 [Xylaria cf. heliscus]|nr:hypothetical protein F4859DRAFT_518613 [Xylaria cf. heliscus]
MSVQAHPEPEDIIYEPRRKVGGGPKISATDNILPLEASDSLDCSIENPWDGIISHQVAYSGNRADYVEEDPIESWYTNVGYLPDLDESILNVLEQVLSSNIISDVKSKLFRTKEDRTQGLNDRNVEIYPCSPADQFLVAFDDMKPIRESGSVIHPLSLHDEVKKQYASEWRPDLEKAAEDEVVVALQRTVMISMLDRYRLIYSLKDGGRSILDFAIERSWDCPFMPTRALKVHDPDRSRMLPRPNPDISIAFRLSSIIPPGLVPTIPEATRRIMTYETQDGTRTKRAFHFLMIEAKSTNNISDDTDGLLQSLNSASQSLHCLYEFFNEADRKKVECDKPCCTPGAKTVTMSDRKSPPAGKDTFVGRFFERVRVFTAVLTGTTITIRMHRACPASTPPFPSSEGRPSFQTIILPDYPLQFEYNELLKLSDKDFTREKVVDTFEKIMVDYGIGQLRPLLQDAAAAISNKFWKWEEENGQQYVLGMRHYSHGQTAPSPSANPPWAPMHYSSASVTSRASSSRPADSLEAQPPSTAQDRESQLEPPRKKTKMYQEDAWT